MRMLIAAMLLLAVGDPGPLTVADRLHTYLSAYAETGLSSGAVLLARGDSVVISEGFGLADRTSGLANTPDTRFRIGSITKSMTWAAIHALAARGRLDLDGPAAAVLETPGLPAGVTIQRLLEHEAGIADWSSFPNAERYSSQPTTLEQLTAWIVAQPLSFEPGTDRRYSNSDYVLLARIIEIASGRSYGDFLADELFRPLGMRSTAHSAAVAPSGAAAGYVPGHEPTPLVGIGDADPSILIGSGSVVSTVGDLFKWSRSSEGRSFPWDNGSRHGEDVEFMGGFVPGFGAWVEHYVADDLTVIVLSNLNNGALQQMVPDLGAILLGQSYAPPPRYGDATVARTARDTYSGSWACEGGISFTIEPENDGRLDMHWRGSGPAQPLWAQSDTLLFYPQDWATIAADGQGAGASLRYVPMSSNGLPCTRKP